MSMKTKYLLSLFILVVVAVLLFLARKSQHSSATSPSIAADVRAKLKPPPPVAINSHKHSGADTKKPDANGVLALNGLALSSFLPNSAVAGLDAETCARLEAYLQDAHKITYGVLVQSGTVSKLPDGSTRIVIAGESSVAGDLKGQVYSSIESIVGKDAMKQMKETLGPKFDATFAYFGEYDTTLDLSMDGGPNANEYVTMKSAYQQVKLLGLSKSNVRSTSVLRTDNFESQFFPLAVLKSAPQKG